MAQPRVTNGRDVGTKLLGVVETSGNEDNCCGTFVLPRQNCLPVRWFVRLG
jgi:hypothetical protein